MFSFEGDYKRTPLQRLGGVSTSNGNSLTYSFAVSNVQIRIFMHRIDFVLIYCPRSRSFAIPDRETLIRRAQQERQKRADVRKQNNGAVIIQSCARSFLIRIKHKERERCAFDEYLRLSGLSNREQLEYLLKRILFFYYKKNQKDGERLVRALLIWFIVLSSVLLSVR